MLIFVLLYIDYIGQSRLSEFGWAFLGLLEFHFEGWVLFAAVMNVSRVHRARQLSKTQRWLGYLLVLIALPWDIVMQATATLWLWELPYRQSPYKDSNWPQFLRREWLLSQRLERLVYRPGGTWGWRNELALKFRRETLDNLDHDGIHRA